MGTSQARRIRFPITDATELRAALGIAAFDITCRCRCQCHAGVCARAIDLDNLDCAAGCRGQRSILDADCLLDGGHALTPSTSTAAPVLAAIDGDGYDEFPPGVDMCRDCGTAHAGDCPVDPADVPYVLIEGHGSMAVEAYFALPEATRIAYDDFVWLAVGHDCLDYARQLSNGVWTCAACGVVLERSGDALVVPAIEARS